MLVLYFISMKSGAVNNLVNCKVFILVGLQFSVKDVGKLLI